MERRFTRRFVIKSKEGLELSMPIRYERYYMNDNIRVQKKDKKYQKEILKNNVVTEKEEIDEKEFQELKKQSTSRIIRDSYLYLKDNRVSIKEYYELSCPFIRVEVEFNNIEEMNSYQKESWMGNEITNTPLAFDKDLRKLNDKELKQEWLRQSNEK